MSSDTKENAICDRCGNYWTYVDIRRCEHGTFCGYCAGYCSDRCDICDECVSRCLCTDCAICNVKTNIGCLHPSACGCGIICTFCISRCAGPFKMYGCVNDTTNIRCRKHKPMCAKCGSCNDCCTHCSVNCSRQLDCRVCLCCKRSYYICQQHGLTIKDMKGFCTNCAAICKGCGSATFNLNNHYYSGWSLICNMYYKHIDMCKKCVLKAHTVLTKECVDIPDLSDIVLSYIDIEKHPINPF